MYAPLLYTLSSIIFLSCWFFFLVFLSLIIFILCSELCRRCQISSARTVNINSISASLVGS